MSIFIRYCLQTMQSADSLFICLLKVFISYEFYLNKSEQSCVKPSYFTSKPMPRHESSASDFVNIF